jgi:hypothetical protein
LGFERQVSAASLAGIDVTVIARLAALWGLLFLLGGILGFVPGITKDEMFLGFFMVNTPHNVLHMASGTIFLIASVLGARAARLWFQIFGGFYVTLALIGFEVGDGLIFNLISNSLIDSWGHAFLGLVLLLIGITVGREAEGSGPRTALSKSKFE